MISLIIKQLMPFLKQKVESGEIDSLLCDLCSEAAERNNINIENETVEILISEEEIDEKRCMMVSFVALNFDCAVRSLESMKLSDVIELIISKL